MPLTIPTSPSPFADLAVAWDLLTFALWVTDRQGRVVWVNAAAEVLVGRSRRAILGDEFASYFPESALWFDEGPAGHEATGQMPGSLSVFRPGGRKEAVKVQVAFSPFPATAALPEGGVLIEMSVLEETLAQERERLSAEVMEANRQLLRNLAHEIKNPLGGIRGAAQLLEVGLDDPEDVECATVIVQETDRLQQLVDQFLAPYRMAENLGEVNVHEVLEHVRQLLSHEFPVGLSIVRDYDISSPPVWGDRTRLTQVFLNLVRNAAQALEAERSSNTAQIPLRTRIVRDVLVGQERMRRALSIEVHDNGPGVPEDMQERIFYPLVTGRAEGTGLGLSLAKTFIHQAGGTLSLESRPGSTTFRVLLPLGKKEKAAATPTGSALNGATGG